MKIKGRILLTSLVGIIATGIVLFIVVLVMKGKISRHIEEELMVQAEKELSTIAKDVHSMLESQNDILLQKVGYDLNVAEDVIAQVGELHEVTETVSWEAVNQYTKEKKTVRLPKMYIGRQWLGKNSNINTKSIVVDKLNNLVGTTCTIFQRMNDSGDMLRVTTNVKKLDNTRAIGTYIPAINPDGNPNPVISKVLRGETYFGRAYVVNAWYLTAYKPVFDNSGKVIGVLYVGVKQESVTSIRESINSIVVGKTGYVFVLGGKGDQKGEVIIHPQSDQIGKNLYDNRDVDGNYYIKEMVEKALTQRKGETSFISYSWKRNEGEKPQPKITTVLYFEPWDWVICSGTYQADFMDAIDRVHALLNGLSLAILIAVIGILVVASISSTVISNRIVSPLVDASDRLKDIAEGEGDLTQRLEIKTKDEVGELSYWFNRFIENIQNIVKEFVKSSKEVNQSSVELSDISSELSDISNDTLKRTNTVAAASEEMTANTAEVSENFKGNAEQTNMIAAGIEEVSISINEISTNTVKSAEVTKQAVNFAKEATTKVNQLGDAAKAISRVTEAITEISEQTNLLALNATIEAARAGDAGKGFAVVANEIKELAQQTADATLDISQQLRGIQESSDETVYVITQISDIIQQIDDITATIASSVEEQNVTTKDNSKSIAEVAAKTETISENLQQSSMAAKQVTEEVQLVNSSVEKVSDSSDMIRQSSEKLKELANGLLSIVNTFKV